MEKNDNGYIVVETVGTFIPFLLLVISILSLENIIALQARVHNALTQAASTLSMYSYVLEATGVADNLITMDEKAGAISDSINSVLSGIDSISKGNIPSGNNILGQLGSMLDDPKGMFQSAANYGLSTAINYASAQMVSPLVERYLTNGDLSGSDYLHSVGVERFDITDCVIIDRNGNIKITASYEIEYTFGALRLPFRPTLRVTQTAITKAWLNGSGEGYFKK